MRKTAFFRYEAGKCLISDLIRHPLTKPGLAILLAELLLFDF